MSEGVAALGARRQQLEPEKRNLGVVSPIDRQRLFFSTYAAVPALSKVASKDGEAIELFDDSKKKLISLITSFSTERRGPSSRDSRLQVYHSLLSLVYWLYPNYPGYNVMKNAVAMFKQAKLAMSLSPDRLSEAYIVGLYVKLRIMPFLIRSKKVDAKEIITVRNDALGILEEFQERKSRDVGLAGLILDGLGFSYYLLEGDKKVAIQYLEKSAQNLSTFSKQYSAEVKDSKQRTIGASLRARLSFFYGLTAVAYCDLAICYETEAENKEGQEMLSYVRSTRSYYQKAYEYARRTPWHSYKGLSAYNLSGTYWKEGEIQIEREKAIELFRRAISLGEESLHWFSLWSRYESDFLGGSWIARYYQRLAKHSSPSEERKLMSRAVRLAMRAETAVSKIRSFRWNLVNLGDIYYSNAEYYGAVAAKSKLSSKAASEDTLGLFKRALTNCLKSKTFYNDKRHSNRVVDVSLLGAETCYELVNTSINTSVLEDVKRYSSLAKRLSNNALKISMSLGWNERVAESNWHLAQIFDSEGKFTKAAEFYDQANQSYLGAMAATPRAKFYQELAYFMHAWNRIELAKVAHRSSQFSSASDLYREASLLISKSRRWQSTSKLYFAESLIERAEMESAVDKPQDSIAAFLRAFQSLRKFSDELKTETYDEKFAHEKISQELSAFCNARIILEKSKEAYKVGDLEKSATGLSQAEAMFSGLAKECVVSDPQRSNELESLGSLCAALNSFQRAQLTGDLGLFLKAKEIFARAAEQSKSKTLRPLLLGLSSFADFLHTSKKIEKSLDDSLDIGLVVECNEAIDNAEVMFRKLGNKSYLGLLKASKHILDATIKMNAAEREIVDTEVKAKLFSEAQRSLSLASRYYQSLGSSERVKESLRMIGTVKDLQRLIPLAHDIIADVASNQIIYSAISSSSAFEQSPESSASMLNSAYAVLDLEILKHVITTDESLAYTVNLSNLGKESAITVRIEDALPEGFKVIESQYSISADRVLDINIRLEPLGTKQISITAKPAGTGEFVWHPSLIYLDSSRNYKVSRSQTGKVAVDPSDKSMDFGAMLSEKTKLEEQLRKLEGERTSESTTEPSEEAIYALKGKISTIEENFLRTKNEFTSMSEELGKIRADLVALNSSTSEEPADMQTKSELETEERILVERIDRRRRLLEQVQLL